MAEIFAYCERGRNAAFWAEPLNAVSNVAFLIAAAVALIAWFAARRPEARGQDRMTALLIGLVAVIGVGSFLFHTFATRWAAIADVAPIGVFMLVYTGYALRRYLGWSWVASALGVAGFVAALQVPFAIPCPVALRGIVDGGRCLNGSLGYVPALAMLGLVGLVAVRGGHPAGRYLLTAAAVFAVSLAARTVDLDWCASMRLWGASRGTHAIWHVLNALTLWLLLMAAVRHGSPLSPARPSSASP